MFYEFFPHLTKDSLKTMGIFVYSTVLYSTVSGIRGVMLMYIMLMLMWSTVYDEYVGFVLHTV